MKVIQPTLPQQYRKDIDVLSVSSASTATTVLADLLDTLNFLAKANAIPYEASARGREPLLGSEASSLKPVGFDCLSCLRRCSSSNFK